MRRRSGWYRSLLGFLFLAILPPLDAGAQAADDAAPMTREAFDALFTRVDNAGRWGALDQKGTLNLITPEVRLEAFQEVRDGGTVSLAHELVAGPIPGAFEEMQLDFMVLSDTLLGPADGSVSWAMERLGLVFHGLSVTHVDALSHMSYRDRVYNAPAAFDPDGVPTRNNVGEMRDGIVTRGVLVDMPRLRGIPDLAGNVSVTVADLEAWEERAGVHVRSGDVLLIRFGHRAREAAVDPSGMEDPTPRIHPSVAPWLRERGVSAVGADFNDGSPSLVPGINVPFHLLALVAMGMPLFDNMELEELAREAADRSRYSFLFMASPLWIRGATGSPLNPLAVF